MFFYFVNVFRFYSSREA